MLIELSHDVRFSFDGPNLCFLGTPEDFKLLAMAMVDLTDHTADRQVIISDLHFVRFEGAKTNVIFNSKKGDDRLAFFDGGDVVFSLDPKYWDRLFRFFVLMSWDMRTHYLNCNERELIDLDLDQEINFICASEYPQLS